MSLLPGGLETADYGTQGWNAIYSSNFQLLDTRLLSVLKSTYKLGEQQVANNASSVNNPAAQTSETLTDSSGGTVSNAISNVGSSFDQATLNNNFASLVDEINKLRADVAESRSRESEYKSAIESLKTSLNNLLVVLRKTGGNGVLKD